MKHCTELKLVVVSEMGANISECLLECIEVAARERRNVELIHNDNVYMISFNDLLATVGTPVKVKTVGTIQPLNKEA